MSPAGKFVLTCRKRGVQITVMGEEVSLRGCRPDVDELMPRLAQVVNDVHAMVSDFIHAIPPRRAERH